MSVQPLEDQLTPNTILTLPNGLYWFVMYCDDSGIVLICILMQLGKVKAYTSRQLKVHKHNYPTHYIELVVMVFALMIWKHYLYAVLVDVLTNHKSL